MCYLGMSNSPLIFNLYVLLCLWHLDLPNFCFCLQLVTDVNMAVSVEAIQAIGNLARGLRTHFSGGSRFLLPTLLVSAYKLVPCSLILKLCLLLLLLIQLHCIL